MSRIRPADRHSIREAAAILAEGGVVAFPTETVYGLGAVVTLDRAIARVFAVKGRPARNPLIAHVAEVAAARPIVQFDERAERLAAAFWPGPLTLVLPLKVGSIVSPLVTAGLPTLAVRLPAHPVARELLGTLGLPVAAPSANRSGRPSPTQAQHVLADLGDAIDLVLDGGACPLGVESTVIDLSEPGRAVLLRPGGVPRRAVEEVIGPLAERRLEEPVRSPGLLGRHYAPSKPLRLEAREVAPDEALLAFGPVVPKGARRTLNLSPKGDLAEAAAHLFAMLRELDRDDVRAIAVMPIPSTGLGEAINDRLRRAALPPEPAAS
ncbi:Threonylcarbamoyl-AMP synthase [bacterium HR40]|nr:Threonylcarbamoyl-AMP synthase [bacterium HR40]